MDSTLLLGLILLFPLAVTFLLVKARLVKNPFRRSRWKQIDGKVPRWVVNAAHRSIEGGEPDFGDEISVYLKGRRYSYKVVFRGTSNLQGVREATWVGTYRARRRKRRNA